jgi:hypothetical protein
MNLAYRLKLPQLSKPTPSRSTPSTKHLLLLLQNVWCTQPNPSSETLESIKTAQALMVWGWI